MHTNFEARAQIIHRSFTRHRMENAVARSDIFVQKVCRRPDGRSHALLQIRLGQTLGEIKILCQSLGRTGNSKR